MKIPIKTLPSELLIAERLLYNSLGFALQNLKVEEESTEYGAAEFSKFRKETERNVGKAFDAAGVRKEPTFLGKLFRGK